MPGDLAELRNVCKDVLHAHRLERNNAWIGSQTFCGGVDDLVRNCADRAKLLRDDEVGLELLEQRAVEMV
ncbi:MAG: hypothetical protein ABSD52_14035 [Candidatus Cybelea sp.]